MRVKLVENSSMPLEVQITYPHYDKNVKKIIQTLKNLEFELHVMKDGEDHMIAVSEVYYIEAVDRKTFIYTKKEIYRHAKKLSFLADCLEEYGFIQINRTCLMNMNRLVKVKTLWNSRLEATLDNNEKVIVSRSYIPGIKEWLNQEESKDEKEISIHTR